MSIGNSNVEIKTEVATESTRDNKIMTASAYAGSAGLLAGLIFCFVKKKGLGAWFGYPLAFSIGASIATNLVARAVIKK